MIAANITWFMKFEFSDSKDVVKQRRIGDRTSVVARYNSHRVNSLFSKRITISLKDFYKKLDSSKAGTCRSDIFLNSVATVREASYKKLNNSTSFSQVLHGRIQKPAQLAIHWQWRHPF
jgi:hypothetical protein